MVSASAGLAARPLGIRWEAERRFIFAFEFGCGTFPMQMFVRYGAYEAPKPIARTCVDGFIHGAQRGEEHGFSGRLGRGLGTLACPGGDFLWQRRFGAASSVMNEERIWDVRRDDDFEQRPGELVDGYRLIREIGAGGFGRVWICRSEALDQLFAVKFVRIDGEGRGGRELAAVQAFKRAGVANPHLMAIEHVGTRARGVFYVMPLADGGPGSDPGHVDWQPLTLARMIRERREAATWFSSAEIREWVGALVRAAGALDAAGLVHRDIKPDNVLFLQGRVVLSDLSLLRGDAEIMTEIGPPGYRAPSWYAESGGRADMYGLAATLYTVLTGNAPDKIGRGAFQWPPQGRLGLCGFEQEAWKQLHDVVLRALEGRRSERYPTYAALLLAVVGSSKPKEGATRRRFSWWRVAIAGAVAVSAAGYYFWNGRVRDEEAIEVAQSPVEAPAQPSAGSSVHIPSSSSPLMVARHEAASLTAEETADYTALAVMVAMYFERGEYLNSLETVDLLLKTYPVANTNPAYSTFRASNLYHVGRKEEALAELRKGLAAKIDLVNLGRRMELWDQLGDLEGAESEITRVIERWRPITLHYMFRIKIRLTRGDYPGAEEDIAAAALLGDEAERKAWAATAPDAYAKEHPGYAAYLAAKRNAP